MVMSFFRLVSAFNPRPLLAELDRYPDLWGSTPIRTADPVSPHREATDILLRFSDLALQRSFLEHAASIERIDYPARAALPEASRLVEAAFPSCELGSLVIARLPHGGRIYGHTDRIPEAEKAFPSAPVPALWFDRYQFVLQGRQLFMCGNEAVTMVQGECWWFDNAAGHSVTNTGPGERIALIADVRLPRPMARERWAT